MPIEVRPCVESDAAGVRALHDRTPPDGSDRIDEVQPRPQRLDDIDAHFDAFWVATDGPTLVGMVGLEHGGVPAPEFVGSLEGAIRLTTLRVAPERQRSGIGLRLVSTAVDWARAQGWVRVVLDTTVQQRGAIALYERSGFSQLGRSMFGDYELVWFERPLSD
jgi:GNAT superfamily N-acetyltransferase